MKSKLQYFILLVFTLAYALPARADFTGPPMEAIVGMFALGIVAGFFACFFLAWIFKSIVEQFIKRKRKHSWFMALFMSLFVGIILYLENSENMLYGIDDYNTRVNVFNILIVVSLIPGWVLGYLITPKKPESDKRTSNNR